MPANLGSRLKVLVLTITLPVLPAFRPPATAQTPKFEDVLSLQSVGGAVISPDGKHIAFTVRNTEWKENRYDNEIWLSRDGGKPAAKQEAKQQAAKEEPASQDVELLTIPDSEQKFTAARIADPFDPLENLEAGMRHLRYLMDRFDPRRAIAAYNAGEGAVRRYGAVPPYRETQNYVQRILAIFQGG